MPESALFVIMPRLRIVGVGRLRKLPIRPSEIFSHLLEYQDARRQSDERPHNCYNGDKSVRQRIDRRRKFGKIGIGLSKNRDHMYNAQELTNRSREGRAGNSHSSYAHLQDLRLMPPKC